MKLLNRLYLYNLRLYLYNLFNNFKYSLNKLKLKNIVLWKKKSKQWWSKIPSISTKRTITSLMKALNIEKTMTYVVGNAGTCPVVIDVYLLFLRVLYVSNLSNLFIPRYSWNTAKVGVKHQPINQSIYFQMSNEIIKRCCREINLDKIFDGYVQTGLQSLNDCIECCETWKEIYDKVRFLYKLKIEQRK